MRIVVLVDDTAGARGLLAEHGFSLWLEVGEHRILFDTGQGLALEHNAQALAIPIAAADAVVLSHGHYDHSGGLAIALSGRSGVPVHAQPEVLAVRYSGCGVVAREIGMPASARLALARRAAFHPTKQPVTVCGALQLTGAIPAAASEKAAAGFFLDADGAQADPIADDQAAFVETRAGTAVLLGCGHAGVVSTLNHVESLTRGRPIHAVIGGMHLGAASQEQIDGVVRDLVARQVAHVVPGHCTGLRATAALMQAFGNRCSQVRVGSAYEFVS